MFHLSLKTAASGAVPITAPSATPALGDVPWSVVDAEENDPFESDPSTPSGNGGDGSGSWSPTHPHSPQLVEQQVVIDQGPYPHCPIFIPSKGRAELDRNTMATFIRDLVPFVLVVEQDEVEAYGALLDRLVGQTFGFAGMVHAAPQSTTAPVSADRDDDDDGEEEGEEAKVMDPASKKASEVPADLWDFPCACCCSPSSSSSSSSSSSADASRPFSAADPSSATSAVSALAQRLSAVFHHGYVFQPPTPGSASAGDSALGREGGAAAAPAAVAERDTTLSASPSTRYPSPAFVLHDVNQVRALSKIEVLPESNRGVSYVRNYILQVLVPRMMVGCGVDRSGNLEELCLSGPGEHSTLTPAALRSAGLEPDVYDALQNKTEMESYLDQRRRRATAMKPSGSAGSRDEAAIDATPSIAGHRPASPSATGTTAQPTRGTPRLLHGLFGFYWVLDDDIYGFYSPKGTGLKQQRISTREMLREVESRLRLLRRNADRASPPPPPVPPAGYLSSASASSPAAPASSFVAPQQQQQQQQFIFTCKEDALANNFISGGKSKLPTLHNYNLYYTTACFSLEYNRFAINATPNALAVNSYNNIACLFNYPLLHNPPQMRYFPPGVPNVRRPEDALVGYLGHSMLWYRFAIREDYDFTLQLIARGLQTLRFRSLSFDVPQMMKVRGGMTDYYRNCHEEIRQQNNRLVLQWPAIAQHWVKGKDDMKRDDIRIRWDLLNPARAKYPGAFLYLTTPLPQLQPQRTVDDGSADVPGDEDHSDSGTAESRKRSRPASPVVVVTDTQDSSGSIGVVRRLEEARTHLTSVAGASLPPPLSSVAPSSSTTTSSSAQRDRKGGYVVERWRDIKPDEARRHVGLVALPNELIHIGQTVAAIPPFFAQQPSVVLATVIERSVEDEGGADRAQVVVWTAVAQDVRGMPFLHVKTCYQPPEEGIVKAAEKLDQFFARMKD